MVASIGAAAVLIACLLPWISAPGFVTFTGTDTVIGVSVVIAAGAMIALAGLMFWPPAKVTGAVLLILCPVSGTAYSLAVVFGRFARFHDQLASAQPGAGLYLAVVGLLVVAVGAGLGIGGTSAIRALAIVAALAVCVLSTLIGISTDRSSVRLQTASPVPVGTASAPCTSAAIDVPGQVATSASTEGFACGSGWAVVYLFSAGSEQIGFFRNSAGQWALTGTTLADSPTAGSDAALAGMPADIFARLQPQALAAIPPGGRFSPVGAPPVS